MCDREQRRLAPDHPYVSMDSALLQKVADEGFPYASSADLSVSGEPLLASNLDQSLQLARAYNLLLNITTNGSLLGGPGMIEKLAPVTGLLSVSIDAAKAETYSKIRPEGRFEEIVAATKRYDEVRKALQPGSRPARTLRHRLQITTVLMRANVAELPDMVRLAHRLGADVLAGAHMLVYSQAMEHESLLNYPDLYERYRAEALRVAESLCQKVVLPPLPAVAGQVQPAAAAGSGLAAQSAPQVGETPAARGSVEGPVRCPFAHRSLYIQPDGSTYPCTNQDPELPIVGNARRQSLREIWNSDVYVRLRERLRTGRLTDYCRRCYIIADQVGGAAAAAGSGQGGD
jgi:radical SAM protein with 4Fe4S-binding SPASM domain